MRNPFSSRGLAAAGIAICCLAAAPPFAAAQDGGAGRTAAAAAARNVYAGGGQVRPAAPVQGDFSAAGGKVIVDQPVAGDASLAGGAVDVRAPVGDDVRAVGGDVSIDSTVGGELFAAGANVTLGPAAVVAHGASLHGSNVTMAGRVAGELTVRARKVTIDGEVGGSVDLAADEIELGPRARIGGGLNYVSASELKQAEGATVAGSITRDPQGPGARGAGGRGQPEAAARGPSWAGGVLSFLGLLAAAALFLLLVPRFGAAAAARIPASPWLALGVGFGTVIALPVLALLLFVTLLGIPVGIALLALYPALLLAGFVVGVLFIGRALAAALRKPVPAGFAGAMAWFTAALLLTALAAQLPFAGGLLAGLLALAGVGACVLELYRRRNGLAGGPVAPVDDVVDQSHHHAAAQQVARDHHRQVGGHAGQGDG